MREVYPLVPLAAEHAIGVAAASYDGSVFFGVVADRDTVPDLDVLLSAIVASVEELLAAARADRIALKDAPRPRRSISTTPGSQRGRRPTSSSG
jgi:diacylglycerol O-acyltransferase